MKALIASGGRGTRLRPITHTQNKHLIPVANKPILFYAIENALNAGIKDIAIVYNADSNDVPEYIGDGIERWGIKLTYIAQKTPGGLAEVVLLAEDFVGNDKFVFYLGDNMVVGGIEKFKKEFLNSNKNCWLTLSKVPDPNRFGVPEIKKGKIISIEEKPKKPKSDFAVTGMYFYDKNIFKACKSIKPSKRGELEISDAHQWLLENGFTIGYSEITGWWKDTGKPADLLEANRLVLDNISSSNNGKVDKKSKVLGKVIIEDGAIIKDSTIRGPVIVGKNCLIEGSYIGPFTAIGNNTQIKNSEVEYSIVLRDCKINNVGIRIEGSILGNDVEVVDANGKPRVHRFMIGDQSRIEIS
ncbi:MAG: glucose-1-phosphate thymidylyltransferase [Bacteroidetes bacterium]|nr:glucose-1-phosphate thymidylyltransferase [Bacteroidota bacterium]